MDFYSIEDSHRVQQRAAQYRKRYPKFASWAQGRGVVEQLFIGPHAPSGFEDLLDGIVS